MAVGARDGTLEKDSVTLAAVWCLRKHFALVTLAPVTMRMFVRLHDRRRGLLWHLRFEFEFGWADVIIWAILDISL